VKHCDIYSAQQRNWTPQHNGNLKKKKLEELVEKLQLDGRKMKRNLDAIHERIKKETQILGN